MRAGRIHPNDPNIRGTSSNHIETDSGCSLRYCVETRNRRVCFVISILMIVLICGLVIPLSVILSVCRKEHLTFHRGKSRTTTSVTTLSASSTTTSTLADYNSTTNNVVTPDYNSTENNSVTPDYNSTENNGVTSDYDSTENNSVTPNYDTSTNNFTINSLHDTITNTIPTKKRN
ncbi:unnamed protein product [Rotaria magnacalcarata]|uniref:Uncharacterized protein n=1 Tax=Rotaria magnacalcarata TaxID=392030 RepID=A0A816VE69_9BILA|nr:unnamed protein product [Rotaria magnacalcarata]CAF2119793.1 unnamed protein product [Rotaria magnacalcarata]CAF4255227.1 unnamed protein product [Rotaria magnacalcarata]CAF4535449.1 unnamed protein product [Rotaria magnacalcarata]